MQVLRVILRCALVSLVQQPGMARAAWPNSPFTNVPVCGFAGEQAAPVLVSDGAGGVIIAWQDGRGGPDLDIYTQHVLASGRVDESWPVGGVVLCAASGDQSKPSIVSDGQGGAIVVWEDARAGSISDIYANHVTAAGVADPAWPLWGRQLSAAPLDQGDPVAVSDGAGGAIVAFRDAHAGTGIDISAQRVLATGEIHPAWPAGGRSLCAAAQTQELPAIVGDGAGGAIVAWMDRRTGFYDIYVQRVLPAGVVDPAWPIDGRAVCTVTGDQFAPVIVSDGAGGALIAWEDFRTGVSMDLFIHHVLATGITDPGWAPGGRAICTLAGNQSFPALAADGEGGAIATWMDNRSGPSYDLYSLRVLATGVADPAWPTDGLALCTATGDQWIPQIAADGAGGAFVAWYDFRGPSPQIFTQRLLFSGVADPAWPVNGRAISSALGDKVDPKLVVDEIGGVIVTWRDSRNANPDIYAQRVGRYGYLGTPEAEIVGVADVPGDQGGVVKLSWKASYLEGEPHNLVTHYRIFRSVPPNVAAARRAAGATLRSVSEPELEPLAGSTDLLVTENSGTTYYWEYVATVASDLLTAYSFLAPTAADSGAIGALATAFMIQARTSGSQHWESTPQSGYSVDDLSPLPPESFSGLYANGVAQLTWSPNQEPDLAGYRLYRGMTPGFVASPATLLTFLADEQYADSSAELFFYKLAAVDSHGNESSHVLLLPANTLDVAIGAEGARLHQPYPNPASTVALLRFSVPRDTPVRLTVFDAAGRRVRTLVDGMVGSGRGEAKWDLRDDAGRAVGSGLYFAHLEVQGRVQVQRLLTFR